MIDIPLPSLGPEMESGKLLKWHVRPGDLVSKGMVIAVVDTEKSAIDVESWHAGKVVQLLAEPGQTIAVGTAILRLEGSDEPLAAATAALPHAPAALPHAAVDAAPVPAASTARVRASPAARQRAGELGVDLAQLTGSGPDGAITLADVSAAATTDRRHNVRAAIAQLMTRSHREIPHYYLWEECDISVAMEWLQQQNLARPAEQRLLPAALLVAATARAAHDFPDFNGTYENERFCPGESVHIGVAVALRTGGLIAPAIRDAHGLSLDQTMQQLSDLVRRARSGGLRSAEVSGQTLTITLLGDEGARGLLGIIHPPQVALVGVGRAQQRAVIVDGQVQARTCVTISLAADHRVSDGRQGARFLTRISALLQEPGKL